MKSTVDAQDINLKQAETEVCQTQEKFGELLLNWIGHHHHPPQKLCVVVVSSRINR